MKLLFERILLESKEDESSAKTLANTQAFGTFTNPDGKDPKKWEKESDREAYYKALKFIRSIIYNETDQNGNETNHQRLVCFNGAPGTIFKYIKGIVRVICDECGGNLKKMRDFINNKNYMKAFDTVISWATSERPKIADPNGKPDKPSPAQAKLDDDIMNNWSLDDFLDKADEIEEERENAEYEGGSSLEGAEFEIIPIDSFKQMNELFGGRKTGRGGKSGRGVDYATEDGGGWCHTNGEHTYNSWVDGGKYKFFVLANKNWENIPPDIGTNYGKNDYGHSLMALLVNRKGGLEKCTLRCNHEGIKGGGFAPDSAYTTYAELSEIAGFDVGKAIRDYLGVKPFRIKNGTFEYTSGRVVDAENFDPSSDIRRVKKVVVKDGVTTISTSAFDGLTSLREVIFPDSVISIGPYAFRGCIALKSITLPETLETIGSSAFAGCTGLSAIEIPDSVKAIDDYCFQKCVNLQSVKLSSSLERISRGMFLGCSELGLGEFSIPDSVNAISAESFRDCIALNTIVVPDAVTDIEKYAFQGCTYLENVKLSENLKLLKEHVFEGCYNIKNFDFGGVTKIESGAFANCGSIKLFIPSSVITIASTTFSGCKGAELTVASPSVYDTLYTIEEKMRGVYKTPMFKLIIDQSLIHDDTEEIELVEYSSHKLVNSAEFRQNPDSVKSVKYVRIKSGVSTIDSEAFEGCTGLIAVLDDNDLSDLTDIDDGAFRGCVSLQSFPFEKATKLDWIGEEAFKGCVSLKRAVLPEETSCPDINRNCFEDCESLEYFYGGNGVTSISNSAFKNSGLVKVEGLSNVSSVDSNAFAGCKNLQVVFLTNSSRVKIADNAFDGCDSLMGIYYRHDSVKDYCERNGIPCAKLD